ncbi:MAG: peptide-binding protein [Alphaproteobacteria bacterium]|nr:peptide-binding protein [Alphaproteobacteria bacterium]
MRLRLLILLACLCAVRPLAAQPAPVTIGQSFLTGSLDASEGPAGWALASHGVAEKLFTVDRSGKVVGALATTAERLGVNQWRVRLRGDRFFSDGTPVVAADVAAALMRTGERNAAARASAGRITVEATDPATLMLTSERSTPIMASVLAEWAFAVYRQAGNGFLYSGPYAVETYRPGDQLLLKANPHHAGMAGKEPVRVRRFADTQAMALAFENGEVDLAFNLPVETLPRLRARRDTTVRSFPVAYQYMMWINTGRPGLHDPLVRRAIDLAIDRRELVAAVQGGVPATGAFATTYAFAEREVRPFDPAAAGRLLDQAGWRLDGDGKRRKDGRTLDIVLVAYPSRPELPVLQPVIRARLAALGLNPQTRIVEQATAVATARDFDLLLWAQHTAPAGDPGFFLNAFFRTGAGNNYASYSSPRVDALLDRLAGVEAAEGRAALSGDIQRQLFEDVPVSFLITPAWHLAYGPRILRYEPWGSDYDIVRADLATK